MAKHNILAALLFAILLTIVPTPHKADAAINFRFNSIAAAPQRQELYIKKINFIGNNSIKSKILKKELSLHSKRFYSYRKIKRAVIYLDLFYKARGFPFSKIKQAAIDLDGTLNIVIDEGIIEQVKILNKNVYALYRIKTTLKITEGSIFNEPKIREELKRTAKVLGTSPFKYFVRPNPNNPQKLDFFIKAESYRSKSIGYAFDIEAFYIQPKLRYTNFDFWGLDHEIKLYASTKIEVWDLQDHVLGADYYLPSIFGKKFRPYVNAEINFARTTRKDINIKYKDRNLIIGLFMENRITASHILQFGILKNFFKISDIEKEEDSLPDFLPVDNYEELSFSKARFAYHYIDNENRFRNDKAFSIHLYFDYFIRKNRKNFFVVTAELTKTLERKYDDFIIKFFYTWRSPGSDFYFDHKLTNEGMRGFDDDLIFSKHSFQLTLEYKLSLYKEKFKLLFFSDNGFYRPIDYSQGGKQGKFRFEYSFGQGFEFNIFEFSCRFYYGVPYKNDLNDGRVYLRIRKVF